MAVVGRNGKRGVAVFVKRGSACAQLNKGGHHGKVTILRRGVERGELFTVRRVDASAASGQPTHNTRVIRSDVKGKRLVATRREQRRALVVVGKCDALRTVNNQTNDCLDVTGRRGMPQWATAVNVNRRSALGGHVWFEVLRLMRIPKKT